MTADEIAELEIDAEARALILIAQQRVERFLSEKLAQGLRVSSVSPLRWVSTGETSGEFVCDVVLEPQHTITVGVAATAET